MGQGVYKIKGTVTDTLNSTTLYMSSVILLRAADTVIAAHGRVQENGLYELRLSKKGKYLLQVSHPGYADYADLIDVTDTLTDLGEIPMLSKAHMLQEVVFTQQVAAIKIKGDTTEYVADSFKVREGATVEDLLKKLPGIQVDRNGQITAQGETVQKVLVDGEEFFADDPKVVTQGIQAGAINKVQVFDKKSDQAEFTGIDDGEKTKTINLQLKDNMKKGIFGKAEAGGGSDGYYQEQAMLNAFRGKRQLAAFGILSNTDKVGLGWQESEKYGGNNNNTEISEDGSFTIYSSDYDEFSGWDGTYRGDGLPKVGTGGLHFANKWNEDKHHASGSYRYALQQVDGRGSKSQVYVLGGDSSRVNNEQKTQLMTGERQGLNGLYEWKIDSLTSMKLSVKGGYKTTGTTSRYATETYNLKGGTAGVRTLNDRYINTNGAEQSMNADLLLRRKFAKKGRTFSLDMKENFTDSRSTGGLLSDTYISGLPAGVPQDTTRINQRKINNSTALSFSAKVTYTEPLSKRLFLEGNYGATINNSSALNSSLDRPVGGIGADVLNDDFSSNYRYNILINRGGLSLKYVYKKLTFSFGSDVSKSDFLQTDMLHGDTSDSYTYINLFPKGNVNYKLSKQTSFNLSYSGSTKQPTITQIQPLNQNTDPLNIVTGNPELKQEFTNRINLRFNNYKVLTHRYTYLGITLNVVDNAISTEQTIDGAVNKTRFVNVDGNYDADWYGGYSFKLRKPEIQVRISLDGSTGKINNFVNGERNVSNNNSFSIGPTISYEKENKYDISVNPKVTYNDNRSAINTLSLNYYVMEVECNGAIQLPKDLEIGSTAEMMFRQQTAVFTGNNNIIKWSAYASKKFLKKKELTLKISVFDILNQNLGFTRTAQGNMITQNNYTTIRRYGMLSLIWNFRHTPGMASGDDDDDD